MKAKGQSSWLKTLFEKKNNEEWLKNLVEKKEIDADQHTFLKDLLAKRDQVEKSDDTNKWWHNLFEKKFDGHVPYWAKEGGHQDVNMNWKWGAQHSASSSHSHSASHSWSHSHTKTHTKTHTTHSKTTKTIRGAKDSSDSSDSSESSEEPMVKGRLDMPMKPLVSGSKHFKPLVASHLRGNDSSSDSESDSDNTLLI